VLDPPAPPPPETAGDPAAEAAWKRVIDRIRGGPVRETTVEIRPEPTNPVDENRDPQIE